MELLKEQDLLNWFEENDIAPIEKDDNYFDIHYHFHIKGLSFSIISLNQYTKKTYQFLKNINYYFEDEPIWEIYCLDIDNNVNRTHNLNNFKKFIDECYEMANKN